MDIQTLSLFHLMTHREGVVSPRQVTGRSKYLLRVEDDRLRPRRTRTRRLALGVRNARKRLGRDATISVAR
jgi:hypothetical protein